MRFRQINLRKLWLSLLLLVGATAIAIPGIQEVAATEDDVVEIGTVDQLKAFRDAVNSGNTYAGKTVKLTTDLDLSGETNWTPIGNLVAYPGQSFNGTFDGDGHSISNVTSSDNTYNYAVAGLFGSVENGTIKNLTVKNVNITSTHYAGGIVAYTSNGPTIENCKVIGGTIKSTPEIVNGSYDNGDKVGGIMGYATAGSTINKCTVEGVTISGYRDLGGIVGYSDGTVTNNTAKNVTVTQDLTNGYKDTPPTTIGDIVGRGSATNNVEANGNKVIKSDPVAQIGETKYETIAEAVAAANANDVIEIIKAGEYTLPGLPNNVTIEGAVDGVVFNHTTNGNIASIPSGATFKNVTFNFGNNNYHGFQHAGTINMEGCTLNGKLFSYGDMNFTNCEFKQTNSDYNMWVYGAGNVVYDQCTFSNTVTGKLLHLYCESADQAHKVTVKDCKFVNKGEESKAAINVKATSGSNALQYELHLEGNNTYEGNFPTAVGEQDNSDHTWILSPLAQVDDRKVNPDNIKVYENDKLIYPVSYVAAIGDEKYTTLEDAFAAVQNGEIVTLLDDVTLSGNLELALEGKSVTLDLATKTLNGRTNLKSGSLTVKNGTANCEGGQPLNVYGSATAGAENYSVLTVAEDVTVSGDYGVCVFGPTASAKAGYGAVVNIAGTLNGTKGTVFVSGNLGNNIAGDMKNVVNITGKINGNNDAGVALNGNATVNVKSGAEITGNTGIAVKRGVLNVEEGATVHATGAENLNPGANNNGTEMTGAAISMTDTYNNYGAMSVNITGGTFTSDNTVALFKEEGTYANAATYTVSGGIFSSPVPAEFCAEGYVPVKISDGKYSVAQGSYVAKIGEDKYVSLQSAVDAAYAMTGDVTIELIDNITGYSIVKQKAGLNLTIDGKEMTVNGQIIIDGDGGYNRSETLDIKNIKFEDDRTNFVAGSDAFIFVPSTNTAGTPYYNKPTNNYSHNVTISNCSFTNTADDLKTVAIKTSSGGGNCYHLVVNNVTGTKLHSLAQLTGSENTNVITNNTIDNSDSFVNVSGGSGTFDISNNTFTSSVTDGYGVRENSSSSAVITLSDNTFTTAKAVVLGKSKSATKGTINVVSGTYVGDIVKDIAATATGKIVISGGKFSAPLGNSDYSQFIAEGKTGVNGLYPEEEQAKNGLGEAVATITDSEGKVTNYASLESAFADAKDGDTVKPLVDITELASNITVGGTHGDSPRVTTAVNPVNVTFDLNGKTIKSDKTIYLVGGSLNITGEGTIETTGSGVSPVGVRYQKDANHSDLDYTSKRTLTIGENVTLKGVDYGLNIFGSNEGTVVNDIEVNVNGTVEGTLFVLGNLKNTDNNVVINVNSGASLKGNVGIALNGFATVNVADNTTIEGTELGIEVRAGNLNVAGGTITSTATEYTVKSNGDGSAAKGAAISVAQHTTKLPISTNITGCTLTGVKTISVADPENGNLAGVTVKVADALANAETVIIPVAYKWVSDGTMSTLTPRDPVAKIGETVYYSLADAIAAVPANGTEATTITLLADVTENVAVSGGKNIVLDLDEKTLTGYIDLYDSELNVKNGNVAGTVYVNGGPASAEAGYNKFTLAADAAITADWGFILYQGPNGNDAYGSVIDINGTVNGTAWVMGNITEGNSVINVNSGAKIEGDVFGLNGLATLNVKEGATIIGSETGIEVRAGNLNVEGGTIKSTATKYEVKSNGSGTTTTGAAIAVAQHTTKLPISTNITGCTLTGVKTISVADPENGNLAGVTVKVADALANAETVIIPVAYKWVSDGTMSTLTPRDPVAKIGETVYYSLADAIAAVPANGTEATTITLLADVTENVAVSGGKNIVLDLDEKTLTGYIDLYDSELNVKNGNVAGTVYVNGGPASAEAGYNKFTLAADAAITADWGFILYQGPNGNDAYGSVIDINGTVNGTAWVMGNITEGNSVINVNSGAKIEGDVFGLNGLATLNVKEGATIIGSETGIEVRAGNLNVEGGTIKSTATKYEVKSNGSGTTTTGAAIAVAQHTTKLPINANILGGTLSGVKTISVADPEGGNYAGVVVTAKDELTVLENNVIPDGYIWESNDDGTSTLKTKEDAGIYDLFDSTIPDKYKAYEDYGVTGNKNVKSVTYTRMFATSDVPYYRPWYIPFDYKITEADTENFVFFRISMIAGSETSGEVDPTTNKIVLYIKRMEAGDVLKANRPYILKPIVATGEYVFKAENTTLYAPDYTSRKHVETSEFKYDFYGNYVKDYPCGPEYSMYYLGSRNAFSPNRSTSKLQSYRWYVKVESNDINADAKPVFEFVEEDGQATGINNTNAESADEIEGIYNSNGIRLESKAKGLNIIKYKSGKTKKIYIK